MPDLLDGLNEEQKIAATHTDGPLIIVAGAGTGKTTVITKRIAWLIEKEFAKADEILALTFTEKAAFEMDERLDLLLPFGYFDRWILTFHSFCERILRENALEIGLSPDFKILDETSQWIFLRKNLDEFNLDYYKPLGNPAKFLSALIKHFSRAKDELVDPADYLKYAEDLRLNNDSPDFIKDLYDKTVHNKEEIEKQEIMRISEISDAYHLYNQLLLENNYLDFGDLICWTIKLFRQRPTVLEKYRQKFKYILVDEFQDTNYSQYELIKILAFPKNNLLIVGDDDQAIFKFRGASISNILQFKNDFPDAKEIVLKNNYRSCQQILDASYEFIKQNNPNRLEVKLSGKISKQLISNISENSLIEHIHCPTLDEEVGFVIDKICAIKNEDKDATWNDFVILVRANDSALAFANEMEKRGVPYYFMALRGLYAKKVILDMVSYLKIVFNRNDNPAFFRVLKMPVFDLSEQDISLATWESKKKTESIFEILKKIQTVKNISPEFAAKTNSFLALLEKHSLLLKDIKLSEFFVRAATDLGLIKELSREDNKKNKEDLSYLQQFLNKIKNFELLETDPSLKNFLELFDFELQAGDEGKLSLNLDEGPEMVKILTVHSAKGLEFKYVFIVNLVDRKFPTTEKKEAIPLPNSLVKEIVPEGDIHLQEERRLFYVAMTRAKKGLFFTSADDYGGAREKKLSRFLLEMGYAKNFTGEKKDKTKMKEVQKAEIIENKTIYLPQKFSFTQLSAFENCPLQYKFAHILHIMAPGNSAKSFGQTMHNTLQKFCMEDSILKNNVQSDLFGQQKEDKADKVPFTQLQKIYKESFIDDWYDSKNLKEARKKQGENILKIFYNDFYENPANIVFLERDFVLGIKDYKIKGKIDRIDRLPDNTLEIIDYKVSKSKDKLEKKDKKQLIIYQIACNEVFNEKVSKLTYYYLDDCKKVSFIPKDKEIDKAKLEIVDTIEKIRSSDFSATPGFQCQFCDFRNICEHKE